MSAVIERTDRHGVRLAWRTDLPLKPRTKPSASARSMGKVLAAEAALRRLATIAECSEASDLAISLMLADLFVIRRALHQQRLDYGMPVNAVLS